MERSYNVREIDELRDACRIRFLYGTTFDGRYLVRQGYSAAEISTCVEELVRTYMLAGKIAGDIYKADREKAGKEE